MHIEHALTYAAAAGAHALLPLLSELTRSRHTQVGVLVVAELWARGGLGGKGHGGGRAWNYRARIGGHGGGGGVT
jgi:hypothetical protein